MSARNPQGRRVAIRAIPQKGSIFLPKVRAKICLASKAGPSGSPASGAAPPVLLRRRRAILVRGRGGRAPRTLVLSFQSDRDCLSFSDRLVHLNPHQHRLAPSDGSEASTGAHSSRGGRNGGRALAPGGVACTARAGGRNNAVGDEEDGKTGESSIASAPSRVAPTRGPAADRSAAEIESYVARLLVDPDFDEFARGLEACIASSPHLRALLDAAVEGE
jgi:hypothetical protein